MFKKDSCCEAFTETCAKLLKDWPCKLIAWVLMPDHFHMIVNPKDGRVKEFLGALKSITARRLIETTSGFDFTRREPDADGAIHQVWQESFKAIPLWSAWMIWQKINYIHANPVKAGLVKSAKDYRWSSFQAFYSGSEEPLIVDRDWWWADDSEKLSKAVKELGWKSLEKRFES